jgi:hypothetical protein
MRCSEALTPALSLRGRGRIEGEGVTSFSPRGEGRDEGRGEREMKNYE